MAKPPSLLRTLGIKIIPKMICIFLGKSPPQMPCKSAGKSEMRWRARDLNSRAYAAAAAMSESLVGASV